MESIGAEVNEVVTSLCYYRQIIDSTLLSQNASFVFVTFPTSTLSTASWVVIEWCTAEAMKNSSLVG